MAKTSSPLADTSRLDPDRGGVLADVLPPLIHVDASSSEASTIRWLLDQLVKEVTAIVQARRWHRSSSRSCYSSRLSGSILLPPNDCHGRMAPSAQRRAYRAGVAPHARRARSGMATRRAGEARGDVTNQFCVAFQSERWRRPAHLPPELANATCGAGASRGRCRSPSWPSPSATNRTARSATRSSGEPAWHPSTINPSSHGWTSPQQMRPIRIHGTHPERIAHATCVSPPSTNSSTPLT